MAIATAFLYFSGEKYSLPPISITRYLDPGLANTSDTLASPLLLEKSLIFFSRQYAEAHSGSKAMSSCSGLSADAIPALKVKQTEMHHWFYLVKSVYVSSVEVRNFFWWRIKWLCSCLLLKIWRCVQEGASVCLAYLPWYCATVNFLFEFGYLCFLCYIGGHSRWRIPHISIFVINHKVYILVLYLRLS